MPFERFKAKHGGTGPFAAMYDAMTGGEGLFGRRGLSNERALTDSLIDSVQGDESLGMGELAEQGRTPMTREEHADFRAGLTQAVLNHRTFEAGIDLFQRNMAGLRARADNEDELGTMDLMQGQGDYAFELLRSQDPALQEKGMQLMGNLMSSQQQFSTALEDRRIQMEASESAGRERIRSEMQADIDSRIVSPIIEDTANYEAIRAQLKGNGSDVAPPSLVSAVLEYSGAALKQSDDGNWNFSIGPLGISDTAMPAMTFSELRDRLDTAFEGRDAYMRTELGNMAAIAQRRGFGINGTQVDDLVFPLANAAYRQREQVVTAPKVSDPDQVQEAVENAEDKVESWLGAFGRATMPNFVQGAADLLEKAMGPEVEPVPYSRTRRRGIIDRSNTGRLPTDD